MTTYTARRPRTDLYQMYQCPRPVTYGPPPAPDMQQVQTAIHAYYMARARAIYRGYTGTWYDDNPAELVSIAALAISEYLHGERRPADTSPLQAARRAITRAEYAARPHTPRGYDPAAEYIRPRKKTAPRPPRPLDPARVDAATPAARARLLRYVRRAAELDGRRADMIENVCSYAAVILGNDDGRRAAARVKSPRLYAAARDYIRRAAALLHDTRRAAMTAPAPAPAPAARVDLLGEMPASPRWYAPLYPYRPRPVTVSAPALYMPALCETVTAYDRRRAARVYISYTTAAALRSTDIAARFGRMPAALRP